jgi:2-methylcitrate dehydratase PrpD
MTELSRILARHVAGLEHRAVPPRALRAARYSLLDAVGVSLAASGLEPACRPFAELAAKEPGPCTVLGYGTRTTPLMAALANGALAHALDFEDAYDGTPAHPNAAAVAAALALAESEPAITGPQLIAALAGSCDLVCRLARALPHNPDDYGFYTPPILGAYGAAAVAARLLALDEDRTLACLALTLSQSTSSSQFKRDPASNVRAVRDAFPAQAGLLAALLAARGVRGFEAPLEGEHGFYALYARAAPDETLLLRDLGREFLGAQVSFKLWPSCRGTHAFIEAAFALRRSHPFELDDIECIVAHGAELNQMLMRPVQQKRRPETAIDAKFSLPFCIALAFVRGLVDLDGFAPEALSDPAVLRLAERVDYVSEPGAGLRESTQGHLKLQLRDGSIVEHRVEHPLGHPEQPLSEAQLVEKFVNCAGRAQRPWSPERARRFAATILALDEAHDSSARVTLRELQS